MYLTCPGAQSLTVVDCTLGDAVLLQVKVTCGLVIVHETVGVTVCTVIWWFGTLATQVWV